MPIDFKCPACGAPMEYDGETTLFQNCKTCGAPIIVPAEVVDENRKTLESKAVQVQQPVPDSQPEQVEVEQPVSQTPLSDPKLIADARIFEETSAGNKIIAIKLHREAFNTDLKTAKEAIEALEREIEKSRTAAAEVIKNTLSEYEGDEMLKIIAKELGAGRKIEAIKAFRETFKTSLKDAKEAVDAMETGVQINLSDYL